MPAAGGTARAYVYPRLDSAVWAAAGAPPVARVLGFDPDDGAAALLDDKGQPRRLDLRASEVRFASKARLSAVTSINGSDIYGVTEKGAVARMTPSGDWSFEPPSPARWVFPQPNGSVVIAGDQGSHTHLWLIRPTDEEIIESATLPLVSRAARTQVGDRIYFAVDTGLIGVKTRDLSPVRSIRFREPIQAVVPTPSGDRLYVALKGVNGLSVVDRYTESVTEKVDLPSAASDLRMDPLGQNILVRPAGGGDSAWVVAVGTDRVKGVIRGEWRNDLPAFAPGGHIAATRGGDVALVDAQTLAVTQTIAGGAKDYWYFFVWNGFRPRSAGLDRPVTFESAASAPPADSTAVPQPARDSTPSPPLRDATPTMVEPPAAVAPRPARYIVSFAAVLNEQKANEIAAGITVTGVKPRVAAVPSGTTTIYRVVLGPYVTRDEAERMGRESRRQYWVYEESK
ncbi:MAG: SPOR domain-containing protein [Gemmatimonadaceae bacterium]|nr:SPOR domain-containing protein [Gemmatimonadaceae bacterium]